MTTDIQKLLDEASAALCQSLFVSLPPLAADWWDLCVVRKLSFQQRQQVERRRLQNLDQLDLAALLRIVDQNWFELADANKLPYDGRNFVKEMQTVRNRWAHAQVTTPPVDDIYRDLDTLQRFLELICPESVLANNVASAKMNLFTPPALSLPIPTAPSPAVSRFNPGNIPQRRCQIEDVVKFGRHRLRYESQPDLVVIQIIRFPAHWDNNPMQLAKFRKDRQ